MQQGVVADELRGEVAALLAPGEHPHLVEVGGALGVEQVVGVAAGEHGEHDLRVEGALQVGGGRLGVASQPCSSVTPASVMA